MVRRPVGHSLRQRKDVGDASKQKDVGDASKQKGRVGKEAERFIVH